MTVKARQISRSTWKQARSERDREIRRRRLPHPVVFAPVDIDDDEVKSPSKAKVSGAKRRRKSDLIDYIADRVGLNKKQASEAFDAAMEAIEQSIAKSEPGASVRVPGLGTFTVRLRAARIGRNPKTGETIKIPTSRSVGFKAAKSLKEAIAR